MDYTALLVARMRRLMFFINEAQEFLDKTKEIYDDYVEQQKKIRKKLSDSNGEKLIFFKEICLIFDIDKSDISFEGFIKSKQILNEYKVHRTIKYKLSEVQKHYDYLVFLKEQYLKDKKYFAY